MPPLPPGFTLDQAPGGASAPPPPPGFTLDSASAAPKAGGAPDDSFLEDLGNSAVRDIGKGVIGAITFVPDMAVAGANILGGAIDKATGLKEPDIEMPSSFWNKQLDKVTKPPTSTFGKAMENVNSAIVTGGLSGLPSAEKAVVEAGEKAVSRVTTKAAEDAHIAGIKLSPAYIGGPIRKDIQSAAGSPKVHQEFSRENEEPIDRLAKLALAVHPSEELTPEVLERIKTDAYKPYDAVRKLGRYKMDDAEYAEYMKDIDAAGGRFASRGEDFGGSRFPEIDAEKNPYRTRSFDAGSALDEMRTLRNLSRQNLKQYNPPANALGYTQREIASALERRLDAFAAKSGQPQLVAQLKAAREKLAKISNVEDSMGAGGHVRADDLKRMMDAGVPLTDSLKTIAVTAKNFPKDVQHMASRGEQGDWSVVDFLLGGSGIISGHPAISGLALARPISRWSLRTEGAQKAMIAGLRKPPPSPINKAVKATARAAGKALPAAARGEAMLGTEHLGDAPDLGEGP
jgi:hypothetical protein